MTIINLTDLDLSTDVLSGKGDSESSRTQVGDYQLFTNEYEEIIERDKQLENELKEVQESNVFVLKFEDEKEHTVEQLFGQEKVYGNVKIPESRNNRSNSIGIILGIIVIVVFSIVWFKKKGKNL